MPKKGDEFELTVNSLAYGGKGFGKADNIAVFVKNGIPGQKLLVRAIRKRRNYLEAVPVKTIEESPFYAPPKCDHFPVCGGCTFQHLDYDQQIEQKKDQVIEIYQRLGGFIDVKLDNVISADNQFHYRNKMEFTFSNRRWILTDEPEGVDSSFALGLHIPGRFDKILNIDSCWIQKPVGNEILQTVKTVAKELGLLPYDIRNHTGFLRNLIIRVGEKTSELMVNIVTSKEDSELLNPIIEKLIENHPKITSIVNNITARRAGVSIGEKEVLVYGNPSIHEKLGEYIFEISANSFFQTNTTQAEKLYNLALEYGGFKGDEILYDLFCGTGSTSIFMSSQVKQVCGFELVQSAVNDAMRNVVANGIGNCKFFEANLDHYFRTTPILKELEKPDVVLLDPPRAGLHKKLVKDVIQLKPQKIVYISCNPATQARDAVLFCEEGYMLEKLGMVDMFPHTPHIETVVLLTTKYNS